jgi:hypothetical protein
MSDDFTRRFPVILIATSCKHFLRFVDRHPAGDIIAPN